MAEYEYPDVPTSVFVVLPKNQEETEFVVVIDKVDQAVDKNKESRMKLPGGGASRDRAIPSSGSAEVFEETGLVIGPPTAKIMEVHKTGPDGSHHWIAVKSLPPVSSKELDFQRKLAAGFDGDARAAIELKIKEVREIWPLEAGTEIDKVWWGRVDNIMSAIAERKFFTDHGRAFKWYMLRRSQSVLDEILRDRRVISWFVDDVGCLVLCYDPECEVCDRDDEPAEPKETMESFLAKEEPKRSLLLSGVAVREVRLKATPPYEQRVAGEVEVMFVESNRFDDRLWLLRDFGAYRSSVTPGEPTLYHNAVVPCTVKLQSPVTVVKLAEMFGVEVERQATVAGDGGALCLLAIGSKRPAHPVYGESAFVPLDLNGAPPDDLIVGLVQAKRINEILDKFNRAHPSHKVWMHNGWIRLPKEVESKMRSRKAAKTVLV